MERSDPKRLDRRLDGFGTRWFDPKGGRIEVLDLAPALSTPEMEQSIRARVAALPGPGVQALAPVRRVERNGATLSVVTATPVGVPLAELLAAAEFGLVDMSSDAAFAIASAMVSRLSDVHDRPGGMAHGALSPAHVIVQRDGGVTFTGWSLADALALLERSRPFLWNEFGLLPSPAGTGLPGRRADVVQLGLLVLAVLLRRVPSGDDVPETLGSLIDDVAAGGADDQVRRWLRAALQLATPAFADAGDASRSWDDVLDAAGRPAGRADVDVLVRQMCGELPLPLVGVPLAVGAPAAPLESPAQHS